MPKRSNNEPYVKKYTEENVQRALEAVQSEGMALRKASKIFHIPRATLQFRLSNKFRDKITPGPSPILTVDEEKTLEDWIITSYRKGFPRRKEDIQASVKNFLDVNPRPNPFKNNVPGDGWYNAFLNRHKQIALQTSESVTAASARVSESDIRGWFENIELYLKEEGFYDILGNSSRVLNGDETNFMLCPKNKKVLAPRGARNVYEVDCAQAKSNLTVMFTFTASGLTTPPMIIYPYKRLPADIAKSVPDDWGVAWSENGWMKSEIFYEYIGNVLHPYLVKIGIQFPVILFVDGHCSHLTYNVSQLCTELKIILIALYPNCTRLLQPADVAAFKPLKNSWKKAVIAFQRETPGEIVTKDKFAPLLKSVINIGIKSETIINGFRATGLSPWNPSAVDYSKCLGKAKKQYLDLNIEDNSDLQLQWNVFENIVSKDKIEVFKNISQQFNSDDENSGLQRLFLNKEDYMLFRIYKEFQLLTPIITIDSSNQQDPSIVRDTKIVNTELPSFETPSNILVDKYENSNVNLTNNVEFIYIDNLNDLPEFDTEIFSSYETNVSVINSAVETSQSANNIDIGNDTESFLKDHALNNISSPKNAEKNNNSEIKNNISIRDVIVWPETPKRSGKKQSKRTSFVITSGKWKDEKLAKELINLETEKEKNERKNERLQKKKIKEEEKVKKVQMKGKKAVKTQENNKENNFSNSINPKELMTQNQVRVQKKAIKRKSKKKELGQDCNEKKIKL